jgi:hypothetical protein
VGGDVIDMSRITRSTHRALLVAAIASAFLITLSSANAQVGGAVQYPPASIGEDAQPPPPARMVPQRMVPQSMSPRRIELGISGPSERPDYSTRGVRPRELPTPPPPADGK